MYLIWTLINAAFVILFFALVLTLFVKGKQLFNNKYGNAVIFVFVLGVIGILGAKKNDFDNTYPLYDAKDIKGNNVLSMNTHVYETIPFKIHLNVSFKKNDAGELVANLSRSTMTGVICGYDWEYRSVIINKQEDGTFHYEMSGSIHWYLFGIKVYTESNIFSGILE